MPHKTKCRPFDIFGYFLLISHNVSTIRNIAVQLIMIGGNSGCYH